MTTPRFLADENIETAIIRATRRLEPGVEIRSLHEAGLRRATDAVVLEQAKQQSIIVVSHDIRTMIDTAKTRIATGAGISGLFIVSRSATPRAVAESLILVWGASAAEEWADRIVYLPF